MEPPRLTLAVSDTQYLLTFVALFIVSLVISNLTALTREHAETAEHRAAQNAELYALSRDLAAAANLDAITQAVLSHVSQTFGRQAAIFLPEGETLTPCAASPGFTPSEDELAVATWAFQHGEPAGRGTDTLPAAGMRCLPLKTARGVVGVLGVKPSTPGTHLTPDQRQLLDAFASEESLRRLRTDYIDLYWLHVWGPLTPIEETLRALDDLVASDKVRYVGVSDTPAWKVAEAQTIARFRGWAPFVALQIEYSLLERTVEGELVPMALEMGLGITPWSPLRSGVLSGKYTRESAKDAKPARGPWVAAAFTERSFAVLDVVRRVAADLDTTPARVALAWVQARPGVASTIIGARSVAQLEDNLGALEVRLPAEATAALDEASKPALDFPADFVRGSGMFRRGGTTVNGQTAPPWPLAPKTDSERH